MKFHPRGTVTIRSLLVLALLFVSVLSVPMCADAATLYSVVASATACDGFTGIGPVCAPASIHTGDLSTSAQTSFNTAYGTGSGSANAAIGLMDAASNAGAPITAGTITATADTKFYDTLKVTGTPGGSGNLLFGLGSTNFVVSPGSNGGTASVDAWILVNSTPTGTLLGSSGMSEYWTSGSSPQITTAPAFVLKVSVGDTLSLYGYVNTTAQALLGGSASTASDPAQIFIASQTTGIGFTVASGVTYPTSVPVPATVWLFGSGLIGLIGVARRRKAA
jgi:hypothetical protein